MSRILLLVVAVLVMIWLLRRALSGRKPGSGAGRPGQPDSPAPELVACAHCGVHLPKNEAFAGRNADDSVSGAYFCSEDHLKLGSG